MTQFEPETPIADQQHGTVNYQVGRTKVAIMLEFDRPVAWLALTSQGARDLATDLRKMAAQLDARRPPEQSKKRKRRKR